MEETNGLGNKWLTLLAVAVGTFMAALDATITSISFPRLAEVFETGPSVVLWVTVAFLLMSSALMLTAGRIGDLFGRKKVYVLGLVVFTIGLILCSLSQSIIQLILFRLVQGGGAAVIMGLSPAIVTAAFSDRERGKALGILAAITLAGGLVGPVLGGVLLDNLEWNSVFYARVPVGIIAIVMARTLLKEQSTSSMSSKFDVWGAATLFGGLSCLFLFINLGVSSGFASAPVLILMSSAIVLLALFFVQERRTRQPLVDLRLFKDRLFTAGHISLGILSFAMAAYMLPHTFLFDTWGWIFYVGIRIASPKFCFKYGCNNPTEWLVIRQGWHKTIVYSWNGLDLPGAFSNQSPWCPIEWC